MAYADGGNRWLDESAPFDDAPAAAAVVAPVREMEAQIRAVPPERLAWSILRCGVFVGPGTFQAATIARLRDGAEVVPCDGRAFMSLAHIQDVAAAFVAAVEQAPAGATCNICAAPVRQGDYLDTLAARMGVEPPRRDPTRLCPPSLRCTNAVARAALGWAPVHDIYPS